MVGWQELSLRRRASRDSLEPIQRTHPDTEDVVDESLPEVKAVGLFLEELLFGSKINHP